MRLRTPLVLSILVLGVFFVFRGYSEVKSIYCPLPVNQAYKTSTSPTIYYITSYCKKRYFPDSQVYSTYYPSYSNVKTVSSTTLNYIAYDIQRVMGNKGGPSIISFYAYPTTIYRGRATTLNWKATGADSISISGIGQVFGTSTQIFPATTTFYTLTATNAIGSVQAKLKVTVLNPPITPTIVSVDALDASVQTGKKTQLKATIITNPLNASISKSVFWKMETGFTSGCGSITSYGYYTAPTLVPTAGYCKVRATSSYNPAKYDTAVVTINLVSTTPLACTSFTYNPWSECRADGTRVRTVASSYPSGCTGGNPILTEACNPSPITYSVVVSLSGGQGEITCNGAPCGSYQSGTTITLRSTPAPGYKSIGFSGACTSNSNTCLFAVKTSNQITAYFAPDQVSPPACTSFEYSTWGSCVGGVQTRVVISQYPSGCTGGTPILSQSCTVTPAVCTSFTYSAWGVCQSNNTQTRTVITSSPAGCAGGSPILTQSCSAVTISNAAVSGISSSGATISWNVSPAATGQIQYGLTTSYGSLSTLEQSSLSYHSQILSGLTPGTTYHYRIVSVANGVTAISPDSTFTTTGGVSACTSFTYSAWGACQPNNTQIRTVSSQTPLGCVGGNPITVQPCIYTGQTNDPSSRLKNCTAVLSHTNSISTQSLPMPGYLQSVIEQPYGTKIIRITGDPGTQVSGISGKTWSNFVGVNYPKHAAWSADGKIIRLSRVSSMSGWVFVDGETYAPLSIKYEPSSLSGGESRWHPTLPDTMITVSGNRQVWHWNVRSNTTTLKYDPANDGETFSSCVGGPIGDWEGNPSQDGRYIALQCGNTSSGKFWVVDLQTGHRVTKVFTATESPFNMTNLDWVSVSPLGNYLVVSQNWLKTVVVDFNGVKFSEWPMDHFDLGVLPDGREIAYSGGQTGTGTRLLSNGEALRSGHAIGNGHHSSLRQLVRGWGYGNEEINNTYLSGELFLDELPSGKTLRIGHHRSVPNSSSRAYEETPFFIPSPDGMRILWQSNWGVVGGPVYTFVADLRDLCPENFSTPICSSFTYSAWGACQSNNTQTRTVLSSSPSGCSGGSPVLSQSCAYSPIAGTTIFKFNATEDTYTNKTLATTNYGNLTSISADNYPDLLEGYLKFNVSGLSGTVSKAMLRLYVTNHTTSSPEVYTSPSTWSEGSLTFNTKPTIGSLIHTGGFDTPLDNWVYYDVTNAVTGNGTYSFRLNPKIENGFAAASKELSGSEPYLEVTTGGTSAPTCSSFTYSAWEACQPNNTQTRVVTSQSPTGCTGGSPILSQSCTYVPPVSTCTSFTYSAWSACQPNNTQTRVVTSQSPLGCVGGSPILSQSCSYTPAPLPAFPGAEGSAAYSKGGRGGMVYEVTNLNSSGSGSLLDCLNAAKQPNCTNNGTQADCARTCVFKVGGNIDVASEWEIWKPYLTVAGQTAPGGGIQLSARNRSSGGLISIHTHDVVWRYTRLRIGYNPQRTGQSGATFAVYQGEAYNVLFDHNSVSWGSDDMLLTWTNYSGVPKDITFSYNLVYEPLKAQATPMSSGAVNSTYANQMTDIDWHHNLLANFSHRSPQSANASTRFVNNIEYNWAFSVINTLGGAKFDIIGNLFKAGPLTPSSVHVVQTWRGHSTAATGDPSLYVVRNKSPHHTDPNTDNWNDMVYELSGYQQSEMGILPTQYKRAAPLPGKGIPITEESISTLENSLHSKVGAYQKLACNGSWVPNRDSSDSRVISNYLNGGGSIVINDNTHCGGGSCWPSLAFGSPCADADHDGLPDEYESIKCGSSTCLMGTSVASNGFTNLENYLNGVELSTNDSTCTSFTYSAWGACQPNNTQTRTVVSQLPSGCSGGSPVITQTCSYTDTTGLLSLSEWIGRYNTANSTIDTTAISSGVPQGCLQKFQSGNSRWMFDGWYCVNGPARMYEATKLKTYIDRVMDLAEAAINSSKYTNLLTAGNAASLGCWVDTITNKSCVGSTYQSSDPASTYKGWHSWGLAGDTSVNGQEFPLYDGQVWRYILSALVVMRYDDSATYSDPAYKARYDNIIAFAKQHVWKKWINRSWGHIYRVNTHMTSHWAEIGLDLWLLSDSSDPNYTQYRQVYENIDHTGIPNLPGVPAAAIGKSFKTNVIPNSSDPLAYNIIMDWGGTGPERTTYGNQIVRVILQSYERDPQTVWTRNDLTMLSRTLMNIIWSGSSATMYVNGATGTETPILSPGWAWLGKYDTSIQMKFPNYGAGRNIEMYGTGASNAYYIFSGGSTNSTCSSFTYSAWGACQPNNTQTRTVLSFSPAGCSGGSPVLSQFCTYSPVAGTTIHKFNASEDTYTNKTLPTNNYGNLTGVSTDNYPDLLEGYFKFNVTGISGPVSKAMLRLYVTNHTTSSPEVYTAPSTWNEGTLTYNNRPTIGNLIHTGGFDTPLDNWIYYDVTNAVSGNGTYSFRLNPKIENCFAAASKELSGSEPYLEITTGGTATTTSFVDPREFGAKGDGVTDDTAAFQAAANTGKELRISNPSVFYRLTGSVNVKNSVKGDGTLPLIKMVSPNGDWGDSIFRIQSYTGTGLIISGLHLNGGWSETGLDSGEHSHGILIAGSKNITIENNVIENNRGDGVYVGTSNPGTAGTKSENIIIRNNTLTDSRRCSIGVISANEVKITGNTMNKKNTFQTPIDIEPNNGNNNTDSVWNVLIDNNVFNSSSSNPVLLYHASDWQIPAGGVGGNITISNNKGDGQSPYVNIYPSSGIWTNVTQTNNTWY